ncbi:DUF4240 domain-containing protein [Flavobacterium chilense]|uniref:DUF4240 domain-containing protein n=1 Tax=Flavobacterium chilense TaxID=946677 RepID=A0A1M7D109_9FLAO|nr:DUF4240 domain-containing protein [Flavobacterium chilense]SHL73160.1 Protein of unknown function [Flavobacterium chilense]
MKLQPTEVLTEDKFWQIIEKSLKTTNTLYPTLDEQQELLVSELKKLSIKEIIAYDCIFRDLKHKAYKQDLWAVAYIVMGGCSDDGFMDFRNWLITRGKNVFYKALEDADSLNDEFNKIQKEDIPEWEDVSYLPMGVIEEEFEKDFDEEATKYDFEYSKEPEINFEWEEDNEESMRAVCPNTFDQWWCNDRF